MRVRQRSNGRDFRHAAFHELMADVGPQLTRIAARLSQPSPRVEHDALVAAMKQQVFLKLPEIIRVRNEGGDWRKYVLTLATNAARDRVAEETRAL